jgi:uncharacterized pyridoxamine 5'-phosphate oxidase family protein
MNKNLQNLITNALFLLKNMFPGIKNPKFNVFQIKGEKLHEKIIISIKIL